MIESKEFKEWCRFITTLPIVEKKLLLKNKLEEYKNNPTTVLYIQIKMLKRIIGEK